MSQIVKKDLSIFRGTYNEIKAFEDNHTVEDMKIYLAWDTQEIFVGNAHGQLILYGVSKSIITRVEEDFRKWVGNNVENITIEEFKKVENKIIETLKQSNESYFDELFDALLSRIDIAEGTIKKYKDEIASYKETCDKNIDDFKIILNSIKNQIPSNLKNRFDDVELTLDTSVDRLKNIDKELGINSTDYFPSDRKSVLSRLSSLEAEADSSSDNMAALQFNLKNLKDAHEDFKKNIGNNEDINLRINTLLTESLEKYNKTILEEISNNYLNKDTIEKKFSDIDSKIISVMTGEDLYMLYATLEKQGLLSTFKPVLCLTDYGIFEKGTFYYYDPIDKYIYPIVGGSNKTQIITKLNFKYFTVSLNEEYPYEINKNPLSLNVRIEREENTEEMSAVKDGNTIFYIEENSKNIITENIDENNWLNLNSTNKNFYHDISLNLDRTLPKQYLLKLVDSCEKDTKDINYELIIRNNADELEAESKICFYKPCMIYFNDELIIRSNEENIIKTHILKKSDRNENIIKLILPVECELLYNIGENIGDYNNGNPLPRNTEDMSSVLLTRINNYNVNGIECDYNVYEIKLNRLYKDLPFTLIKGGTNE